MTGPASSLLEVAVVLPVRGTYTYRDPRGAGPVPLGTQVVVPFGARTVTGFVVGHPVAAAPEARARRRWTSRRSSRASRPSTTT